MKKWRYGSAILAVICSMALAAVCWAAPEPSASNPAFTTAVSQIKGALPVAATVVDQTVTMKIEQRLMEYERPAWLHDGATAKTSLDTSDSQPGIHADRGAGTRSAPLRL